MSIAQSTIIAEYCRRTPGSARLAQSARAVLPSGVAHDSRRLQPHPIYIARASGSRKWDVDGNEYVDYSGGHGALLLGHNHPHVTAAIEDQLTRGTHFGACHEGEIRWATAVRELMPSCELVRFTNSGTEATLLAVRLARAFTGRPKMLRFVGHFHGWHDHAAFGVNSHFDGTPSPGVLTRLADDVVLVPAGDAQATAQALARGDVAGVIIEPTGASWGQVPLPEGFLATLRELTERHGAILVFDEVISGFRCSPGGAQVHYGIRPDLTTLAKILAGGLPGGAIAGRADIMEWLAFSSDQQRREKIPHYGTFNANPLSAAAGVATLHLVATTDACQRANDYAHQLRNRLNEVLREAGSDWIVYGSFSGFHIHTNPAGLPLTASDFAKGTVDATMIKAAPPRDLVTKLRLGMLLHGVDMLGWPGGPTSAVHSAADLDHTVGAFRETVQMLRAEGEFERGN